MCGRFVRISPYTIIAESFGVTSNILDPGPRFNIAPGSDILVITKAPEGRRFANFRWGFVPSWRKEPTAAIINARAETLGSKPSFRQAFHSRRCIVVADGFFEWQKDFSSRAPRKFPFFIRLKSQRPFGIAAIYERRDSGSVACALVTTTANGLVKPLHDRMPAIVPPDHIEKWLDSSLVIDLAMSILAPYPESEMESYPVHPSVNSPRFDSASCIEPWRIQNLP